MYLRTGLNARTESRGSIQRDSGVTYGEAAYVDGLDIPVAHRGGPSAEWISGAGRLRRFSLAWRSWEELPGVPARHRVKEGDERLRSYRERLQGRDVLATIHEAAEFLTSRA